MVDAASEKGKILKTIKTYCQKVLVTFENNLVQDCQQDLSEIWPCDLVFDPTQSIFKLSLDIIKTNILKKMSTWLELKMQLQEC